MTILTERIPLDSLLSGKGSDQRIKGLADRIKSGSVFIYPTDTIYGIGGISDNKAVEKRIAAIKNRNKSSPFLLVAPDLKYFDSFGLLFSKSAKILAKKFWPGNITLIVPSKTNSDGVGIRISNHPFIKALFSELDSPLYSTSANHSDQPYVNDPDIILSSFRNKVDFMVDAGVLPESKPSTVVKTHTDDTIEIIREGVVTKEQIQQTLLA